MTAFTEGDLRLAAQLVEQGVAQRDRDAGGDLTLAEWKARNLLVVALRERLAYEERVLAEIEARLQKAAQGRQRP